MIDGFCSYLFNKSHAACYSFISVCTMYLKTFYRTEFLAALLSLQTNQKKIDLYCKVADGYGIEMCTPDINLSNENFTAVDGKILYGLGSIKGVGKTAIPTLIANRPYADLADAYGKAGSKAFNKKIGEALIKAGAFDFVNPNRHFLLNEFKVVRKARKEERYIEEEYDKQLCIQYEKEVLGSPITYKPYWDTVQVGECVSACMNLINVKEKVDKNGNMMAFITVAIDDCIIDGIAFASLYCKNHDIFNHKKNKTLTATIEKNDRGGFIVKRLLKEAPVITTPNNTITDAMIGEFDKLLERI